MAQRAGCPLTEVNMKAVKYLKTIGMLMKDIAELMGVSCQALYIKFKWVALQVTMQHANPAGTEDRVDVELAGGYI